MPKGKTRLFCLCETPLNFDDFEYYCENCEERFPRDVYNEKGEIDLISALELVSKDHVNVLEKSLIETFEGVVYSARTFTFTRSGQDWSLTDIKETKKVWEDEDPDIVSDEIQSLIAESGADFHFMSE